ncbi:zinc ribbon domain-containing protein [Brasilonema bromeliae]|uniref:Transposase n=1 Tax=Brasilonema bromeliae SPC951 TaxID=385972 RepID=A0ABX1PBJ9_9CYAN|nr:zinc ribbon domain-containing protein [Brasilonema bromeliae]NMG21838.1 transposase [Brasilonema bromeliae SPC951]
MRERIRNIVDEAHKQVAHYICSQFDVILLPSFETSEMVSQRGGRVPRHKATGEPVRVVKKSIKLRSKSVRAMLSWSHYRFKEYLKFKAQEWNTQVIEVSEAYTSITCTKCGHIHTKLGGNKKFKCPSCGHTLPRDLNGSLGIYLKALVERPELLQWREHLLPMGNQS